MQDMNVLHSQERKVAQKQRGWRDYYLATQSDTGVSAFWRWLSTHAGQSVFYPGKLACAMVSCLAA